MLSGYIGLSNIWGCSTSENDKYEKLSASDKKAVKELCTCLEIVLPYREKIKNARLVNDSLTVSRYMDSLNSKSEEYGKCMNKLSSLDTGLSKPSHHSNPKEYNRLFSEYLYEKHPLCAPYIIGADSSYFKQ
jgi:hypothetical protein